MQLTTIRNGVKGYLAIVRRIEYQRIDGNIRSSVGLILLWHRDIRDGNRIACRHIKLYIRHTGLSKLTLATALLDTLRDFHSIHIDVNIGYLFSLVKLHAVVVSLQTMVSCRQSTDGNIEFRGARRDIAVIIASDNQCITQDAGAVIATHDTILPPLRLDVAYLGVVMIRIHRLAALRSCYGDGDAIHLFRI